MVLGQDQQYDESWEELDKVRRRQELRRRLKMENIEKRYSPYKQLQGILYTDHASDRYAELRKYGRMPGAPLHPKVFFSLCGTFFIPLGIFCFIYNWERKEYLEKYASGEIPYEDRLYKVWT